MTTELPPGGKILQFGKAAAQTPVVPPPAGDDEERDFDFNFRDGTVYQGTGYLVATSTFMGLGQKSGRIIFLAPMDRIAYVELVSLDAVDDEPTATTE